MELERQQPERETATTTTTRTSARPSRLELGPAPLPPDWSSIAAGHDGAVRQRQDSGQLQAQAQAQQELLASLHATETSFLDTLSALLHKNFDLTPSSATLTTSTTTSSSSQQEHDDVYKPVLISLRKACQKVDQVANPFASSSEMKQVASVNPDTAPTDEIRTRVEHLLPYMSSAQGSDAQLARNLAGLLGCLTRLQNLYRDSPTLANTHGLRTPAQTPKTEMPPSPSYAYFPQSESSAQAANESYGTLHRQAKILQSSRVDRHDGQGSANPFRAVEEAEVELLWGRIDDMLEAIAPASAASQTRDRAASTAAASSSDYTFPSQNNRSGIETVLVGPTPKMGTEDFGRLPEYEHSAPPGYSASGMVSNESRYSEDRKDSLDLEESRPTRRVSSRHPHTGDEKMQLDLDRMTSAIERLYVAAPQLANQRVAYTHRPLSATSLSVRQELREAQLAKLGSAVERLSRGRMEDQRANLGELPMAKAKGKETAAHRLESLEKLLQDIDKAANRSLTDQRVEISSKQQAVLTGARETARAAASNLRFLDRDEVAFREHLLDSIGKGRMTGQDASFPPSDHRSHTSAPPSNTSFFSGVAAKRRSFAPVNGSSLAVPAQGRARSNSAGAELPLPAHVQQDNKTVKKRFSVSRLLSKDKDAWNAAANGTTGRRGSKAGLASTSRYDAPFQGDGPSSLRYTVEEMKNVGTMTLRCWDERFESCSAPASLAAEAWSTTYVNSTSMRLHTGWPQTSSYLRLPAAASLPNSLDSGDRSQKFVDAVYKSDHFEIRLLTQEGQSSTRTREDLDLTFPYPASAFRTYRPDFLVCSSAKCTGRAVLADLKDVDRYNDLPSEYWAELLDAWMCHQDQTLSEELIQKGNNIWPKDRQGLISSSGVLLTASNARGWRIAENAEPVTLPDGQWQTVKCAQCNSVIGRASPGPARVLGSKDEMAFVRLTKAAIQPSPSSNMPIHPLSSHITAALLETSMSRAIHRFVIEEEEEGKPSLVLWIFNPYIRLFSNHPSFAHDEPVTAVKILYCAIDASTDLDKVLRGAETETLAYSTDICADLRELLESSTEIYPRSQQKLGEWNVGWLQRF